MYVWLAFFTRHRPASTIANPACMNMTRKPVTSVQTKLTAILFWPTWLATSPNVRPVLALATGTSLTVPVIVPPGSPLARVEVVGAAASGVLQLGSRRGRCGVSPSHSRCACHEQDRQGATPGCKACNSHRLSSMIGLNCAEENWEEQSSLPDSVLADRGRQNEADSGKRDGKAHNRSDQTPANAGREVQSEEDEQPARPAQRLRQSVSSPPVAGHLRSCLRGA